MRHYADILNPLFVNEKCRVFEVLFQFVCTLVRAAGMTDTGWDSYTESTGFWQILPTCALSIIPMTDFQIHVTLMPGLH